MEDFMNRKLRGFSAFALILALVVGSGLSVYASPAGEWGAAAAAKDTSLSLESMMMYAIQDEYLARAEYVAIMKKYGEMRPFSNIMKAEENHIAWLKEEYASRSLPIPADEAARWVVLPATLKDAFEAGVKAEIDNIAMYDHFLADPRLARKENAALRSLFVRLRDASKNHLSAFQNQLSKY